MISDTERREVARRLREYVDLPDDWWEETCAEFYIEKCVFGNVERHGEGELFARLADLIEPPYPDATASHKGWRAEVYDPDGVLASPSNVAADLVRAHADGEGPSIDRDALLELADEMEEGDVTYLVSTQYVLDSYASRIRDALGASDG